MSTHPAVRKDPYRLIVPAGADKHARYRLGKFARWLAENGRHWYEPDLAAYRDWMLQSYAPATVSSHLSTIRGRYGALVRDRDRFYALFEGQTDDPLLRKALVDELVTRLQNALDPATAPVEVETVQDVADSRHLRLTSAQASALIAAPGVETLRGLRDTAVIALLLCTGIREAELCHLDVPDLRQRFGGELALRVRQGKGCKSRLVPYGELAWSLAIVERWLAAIRTGDGPVFRGFFRGNRRLRQGRLSVRTVQYLVGGYPVMIDGQAVRVRVHDLRRTYARRLYEAGVDLVAIQQNLGHADLKTTLGYIGSLDASARRAKAVYSYDLRQLDKAPLGECNGRP